MYMASPHPLSQHQHAIDLRWSQSPPQVKAAPAASGNRPDSRELPTWTPLPDLEAEPQVGNDDDSLTDELALDYNDDDLPRTNRRISASASVSASAGKLKFILHPKSAGYAASSTPADVKDDAAPHLDAVRSNMGAHELATALNESFSAAGPSSQPLAPSPSRERLTLRLPPMKTQSAVIHPAPKRRLWPSVGGLRLPGAKPPVPKPPVPKPPVPKDDLFSAETSRASSAVQEDVVVKTFPKTIVIPESISTAARTRPAKLKVVQARPRDFRSKPHSKPQYVRKSWYVKPDDTPYHEADVEELEEWTKANIAPVVFGKPRYMKKRSPETVRSEIRINVRHISGSVGEGLAKDGSLESTKDTTTVYDRSRAVATLNIPRSRRAELIIAELFGEDKLVEETVEEDGENDQEGENDLSSHLESVIETEAPDTLPDILSRPSSPSGGLDPSTEAPTSSPKLSLSRPIQLQGPSFAEEVAGDVIEQKTKSSQKVAPSEPIPEPPPPVPPQDPSLDQEIHEDMIEIISPLVIEAQRAAHTSSPPPPARGPSIGATEFHSPSYPSPPASVIDDNSLHSLPVQEFSHSARQASADPKPTTQSNATSNDPVLDKPSFLDSNLPERNELTVQTISPRPVSPAMPIVEPPSPQSRPSPATRPISPAMRQDPNPVIPSHQPALAFHVFQPLETDATAPPIPTIFNRKPRYRDLFMGNPGEETHERYIELARKQMVIAEVNPYLLRPALYSDEEESEVDESDEVDELADDSEDDGLQVEEANVSSISQRADSGNDHTQTTRRSTRLSVPSSRISRGVTRTRASNNAESISAISSSRTTRNREQRATSKRTRGSPSPAKSKRPRIDSSVTEDELAEVEKELVNPPKGLAVQVLQWNSALQTLIKGKKKLQQQDLHDLNLAVGEIRLKIPYIRMTSALAQTVNIIANWDDKDVTDTDKWRLRKTAKNAVRVWRGKRPGM